MPEIIKAGMLYTAFAPLYHIDDKDHPYIRDMNEYIDMYQHKIVKNYNVCLSDLVSNKGKMKPMDKNEFFSFIWATTDYPEELARIAKHFGVNKFLVERIAAYLTLNYYKEAAPKSHPFEDMSELFNDNKFVVGLMDAIQSKYPEITYRGNQSIRGIIDGRFQSIKINHRFIRKIADLVPIYLNYGYNLKVQEKNSDNYKNMSIGEFLDETNKFKPHIIMRYKGLSENSSEELWTTTLNPKNRILVQYTMEDGERDAKIFAKLHGDSNADKIARKAMMSEYKIKRSDLDN